MQSKNKNGGVQFSKRYWAYMLAKRHLGGKSGRKIFPIQESSGQNLREITTGESQAYRTFDPKGIAKTIVSQAGGVGAKTGLYITRVNRKEKVYDVKTTEKSGALTSTMFKGIDTSGRTGVIEETRIRRLTPKECERLQGFPDGWTEGLSDTQRYKVLGNAISVPVVKAIAERLIV